MHWDTVKRLLKRHGCRFVRARRIPPKEAPQAAQEAMRRALLKLHRLEEQGRCQVLYGDECGFSLCPSLPYLWQKPGTRLGLPAHPHSKRLSVLGFWRRDNRFWFFPLQGRMTADFFIQSVERLLKQREQEKEETPVVLVLDNASVHRARAVHGRRAYWKKRGLRLLFLPPYCPHLNRIERLWQQIKYRWIEPLAYASFDSLCHNVTSILNSIGSKYRLSFA